MISKSQISFVKALHRKKTREEEGLFLVEGVKMVEELLASSYPIHSLYAKTDYLKKLANINPNSAAYPIIPVSEAELQKISTLQTANEVLALVYIPESLSEILRNDWIIMLDDLQDPGNMGTIIRIADWFGIKQIIVSPNSVEVYNPKVVQSTMGSLFRCQIIRTDLAKALSETTLPVYGALLEGKSLYQAPFNQAGIILMGNESQGISAALRPFINHPLCIPGYGAAESLNVGIATAVFCSEMRRRQSPRDCL